MNQSERNMPSILSSVLAEVTVFLWIVFAFSSGVLMAGGVVVFVNRILGIAKAGAWSVLFLFALFPMFSVMMFFFPLFIWEHAARAVETSKRWWRVQFIVKKRPPSSFLPVSTAYAIAQTRADNEYEYNLAVSENRLADARRIRFFGRFIILKAATYDLVVTLFEYATDSVKNMFRLS